MIAGSLHRIQSDNTKMRRLSCDISYVFCIGNSYASCRNLTSTDTTLTIYKFNPRKPILFSLAEAIYLVNCSNCLPSV